MHSTRSLLFPGLPHKYAIVLVGFVRVVFMNPWIRPQSRPLLTSPGRRQVAREFPTLIALQAPTFGPLAAACVFVTAAMAAIGVYRRVQAVDRNVLQPLSMQEVPGRSTWAMASASGV